MQEYSEKWSRQNVLLHSLLGVSNLKQGGSPAINFNFSIKDKRLVSEIIVRPTTEQRYEHSSSFTQLCSGYLYAWQRKYIQYLWWKKKIYVYMQEYSFQLGLLYVLLYSLLCFPYLTNYETRKEFNTGTRVAACRDN